MDKKGINKFKRFLMNEGMNTMFYGFYKEYRHDDNPEDVQEYLMSVPQKFVISWAFDTSKFKCGAAYGAKYWDNLDTKWKKLIGKDDERSGFETTGIERETEEIAKEDKRNATATAACQKVVENDWAGLDLADVNANAFKSMPMPNENEIRVSTKSKNVVVLNSVLVSLLDGAGFDTMSIQVDRTTNRFVMVFGKGLQFRISRYSKDVKAVQFKDVIKLLEKYLERTFDENKVYYIRIAERMWSKSHSQYAIILSTKFTTKDR